MRHVFDRHAGCFRGAAANPIGSFDAREERLLAVPDSDRQRLTARAVDEQLGALESGLLYLVERLAEASIAPSTSSEGSLYVLTRAHMESSFRPVRRAYDMNRGEATPAFS